MGTKFHVNLYIIEENMVPLFGKVHGKIKKIELAFYTNSISKMLSEVVCFLRISYIMH